MTTCFVQNDRVFTQIMMISLKLLFWTKKVVIWWLFNDDLSARERERRGKKELEIPRHRVINGKKDVNFLVWYFKRPCKLICDIPNLQHLISPLLYSPCLPCIKWSMLSSLVPASERLRRVQRQFCTSLVLAWLRWIERACKFEK